MTSEQISKQIQMCNWAQRWVAGVKGHLADAQREIGSDDYAYYAAEDQLDMGKLAWVAWILYPENRKQADLFILSVHQLIHERIQNQ